LSASAGPQAPNNLAGLGAIIVLFGVLAFAANANEFLKQLVIAPGTAAALAISPNCRPDELEEENLSQRECELLVSNVQIQLASSPDWFRPLQLGLAAVGSLLSLFTLCVGFALINARTIKPYAAVICFGLLPALDVIGFIAAASTGPLLRALYLWPTLLWFFIHLCLLLAVWQYLIGSKSDDHA